MQGWQFIGNVKPVDTDGISVHGAAGLHISEVHIISGSTQSNSYDCGCHAIMAMRAVAVVAMTGQHIETQLPAESDANADAAWRLQVAEECLAGQIEL